MCRLLTGVLLVAFLVAVMAAPLRAEEEQQIPVEVVKQVKAATVLVKVHFEKAEGSGTGFLVATEGKTGYLVTNVHVLAPLDVTPPKVIVKPQSTFDTPPPVWTPLMAPPPSKRGPTLQTRPGTKGPSNPSSPTARYLPSYRGPSRSAVRVQLIPGRIQVLLPTSIDVVFNSGRDTEKVVAATVSGIDLDHNLAILRIQNVADLPQPIKPPEELELLETTPVHVFGFPFGQKLSTDGKNPGMTVGSGIIASIRDDEDGDTQVVQIDGDVNPGNSGGPVVDSKGNLIGVAVAGINETNIGLAIPATDLTKMLAGRIGDMTVKRKLLQPGLVKIDFEIVMIDPLRKISKTMVRYRPTDELPAAKNENKDGKIVPLPGAKEIEMKIDGPIASGSLTLNEQGKIERSYTFQPKYVHANQGTVVTPPTAPYAMSFRNSVAPDNKATFTTSIGGVSLEERAKADAIAKAKSEYVPKTKPGETRTVPLRSLTSDGAQAEEQVKVTLLSQNNSMMPSCLAWSLDKSSFYSLEDGGAFSFCIVRRVGFSGGQVIAEQRLEESGLWLSLSSEGVIVTCPKTKTVKILDTNTLKIRRSVLVPDVKRAISAPDLDFALGVTNSTTSFQSIDLKAGKVAGEWTPDPQHAGNHLSARFTEDGRFLYFAGVDQSIVRWRVSGRNLAFDDQSAPVILESSGGLSISGDGQYVAAPCRGVGNRRIEGGLNSSGGIGANANYVFGPGKLSSLQWTLGQGEVPLAIAFDLKSGLIYASNMGGKLILFNMEGSRIKEFKVHSPGDFLADITQILVHPDGRRLVILDANQYDRKLWYADLTSAELQRPSPVPAAAQVAAIPPPAAVIAPAPKVTPSGKSPDSTTVVALRCLDKDVKTNAQPQEQVKLTSLASGKISIPNCVTWSTDGKSFYYLEQQNPHPTIPGPAVVHRVSFPEGEEIAEAKVQFPCDWISLSAQGLIVTSASTNKIWVLDPETLATRDSISMPAAKRAISAPALDFAFVAVNSKDRLQVIDLREGKTSEKPAVDPKHSGSFANAIMSSDGKFVFSLGPKMTGNIVRWKVSGQKLVYDGETDALILNEFSGLSVSADGQYAAAPCRDMGNIMVGRGPDSKDMVAANGNYVFGRGKMETPLCLLGEGEAPLAVAFDVKTGLIYGFNAKSNDPGLGGKIVVFNKDGKRIKEFQLSEDRFRSGASTVEQILVHPDGRKLIILGDRHALWFADLTSATSLQPLATPSNTGAEAASIAAPPVVAAQVTKTRKWTDASGKFSVEAELIEVKDGKVYLRRPDGNAIGISVDKLSKADQQYIATIADKESAKP